MITLLRKMKVSHRSVLIICYPLAPTSDFDQLSFFHSRLPHTSAYTLPSSFSSGNDLIDLDPHFTSPSVLDWLEKMAISYQLERGENLLSTILREGPLEYEARTTVDEENLSLQLAQVCALTPLPIASHDFLRADEAIYCYGNNAFLNGFGYDWDEFVQLPSRRCVETDDEVLERQRLLDAVKDIAIMKSLTGEKGDVAEDVASNYDNLIRVRKDGRKILLKGVNLWNVYDVNNSHDLLSLRSSIKSGEIKAIGQAVWIKTVEYLQK